MTTRYIASYVGAFKELVSFSTDSDHFVKARKFTGASKSSPKAIGIYICVQLLNVHVS